MSLLLALDEFGRYLANRFWVGLYAWYLEPSALNDPSEYTDYTDEQLSELPLKFNINPYDEGHDELPIIRNATEIKYLATQELSD